MIEIVNINFAVSRAFTLRTLCAKIIEMHFSWITLTVLLNPLFANQKIPLLYFLGFINFYTTDTSISILI